MAAAVAMAALAASPASAATFKADCDKGQSIQQKLDIATNGDTVEVSGTCSESVVMRTDGVTLDCETRANASITGTAGASSTVRVVAGNVTIENCTIARGDSTRGAVVVARSGSAAILDNLLSDVAVIQSSYGQLIGNEVTGAASNGVVVSGGYADIIDNNIHDNTDSGVLVTGGGTADIVDNTITGHNGARRSGVIAVNGSVARFTDITFGSAPNVITGNTRGISCFSNSVVNFGPSSAPVAQGSAGDNGADFPTGGGCSVNPSGFNPFP
jgi:hypothetical protein